jgi:predicted phage baseplate assembly protein
LAGQIIEVREPTPPGDADHQRIVADEGPDAIRTVTDAAGNVMEVWVRWHAVAAMSLSTPSDRHYVVDNVTGTITFGDSVHGRIPPAGKDNIVARIYRAGGGAKGQCAARTLTELKTAIAFVDKVFNHEASRGGADQEAIANVATSGPLRIKSRDRAVTVEDYEWLAREAAGEVAKSRCLALTKADFLTEENRQGTDSGWITVIIVPQGEEDQPLPTENLLGTVKDFLTARSLATLGNRLDVIGPRYVPIDVTAEFIPRRIEEAKTVEKRVFDNLRAFLHPLSGGPDGKGWEFGRAIYLSEVAAVVQGTEGVDRVRNLTIRKSGTAASQDRIAMGNNDLAASGHHTIVATGA